MGKKFYAQDETLVLAEVVFAFVQMAHFKTRSAI